MPLPYLCAYEDDKLKNIYDEFHMQIKNLTTKIKSTYGDGLLIDVRGL